MADAWVEQRRQQIRERMRREPGYAPIGVSELRDLGVDIAGNKLQTYEQAAGARVPGGLPQEGFLAPRPSPFEGDYPPGWSQQGTELQRALQQRADQFQPDPTFGKETEAERAARRAAQDAAYQQSVSPPPPMGDMARPEGPVGGLPGAGPPDPFAGTFPPRPEGLAGGLPGQPPPPFNMARPEGPAAGLPQMTPNMPRPRPMDTTIAGRPDAPLGGMPAPPQFAGNPPQPRPNTDARFAMLPNGPREWSLGIQEPGGQQSRLPQNRPPLPTDGPPNPLASDPAQRIAGAFPPAPSPAQPAPAPASDPFLTGLPAAGNLGDPNVARPGNDFGPMPTPGGAMSALPPASPDFRAREEARQTLRLHPDTGRIATAPGLQQFREPARQPFQPQEGPLIRKDLTEAAANYQPARLPRPRSSAQYGPPTPMEAMGSDVPPEPQSYTPFTPAPAPPPRGPVMRADSGLATTPGSLSFGPSMEEGPYNPTAMGGPTTPETPDEARARQALIDRLNSAPGEDVIAGPEEGAINQGQPPPPPPPPTVQQAPQQTVDEAVYGDTDGPRTGLESYLQYEGPTARSRKPGFFGSFDREHFVGGPGLTGPLDPAKQQLREGGGRYFKNAAKGGRGDYKAPIGTRTAGRIGGIVGGTVGFGAGWFGPTGGLLGAGLGYRGGRSIGRGIGKLGAFDPNRGFFDSRRKRDKGEEDGKTPKTPTFNPAKTGNMFGGGGGGSGLGSDRSIGRDYGGYGYGSSDPYAGYGGYGGGYGGRYIDQGIGGAYRNR